MADILHRIQIKSSPDKIYQAVTTAAGLSKWWTKDVKTNPKVNTIAEFGFGSLITKMRIDKLVSNQRVEWTCIDGPDEWIGTYLFFDLSAESENTIVRFGQKNWKEASDFYSHCSCKWSYFLHSLKSLVENGQGTPFPDDTKI